MDKELLEAISQMMDAKLDARDEHLSQMMDAKLEPLKTDMMEVKADMMEVKADMAEVKQRTTRIEITLENDVAKKLSSLNEGHQLNSELLNGIRDTVMDMESTVTALDVYHSLKNDDKTITLKIVP